MRRARRRSAFRSGINSELELRPLMNVFIVLIPMLLISAVFMEIRVIEMSLPRFTEAGAGEAVDTPFDLALRIAPGAYVVEADGVPVQAVKRTVGPDGKAAPDAAVGTQLTAALARIAATHAGHREVRILAAPGTRYEEIVTLMDLARAAGLTAPALESTGTEGA